LLVKNKDIRLVYKPHPRVITGTAPVMAAHERILAALRAANGTREPGDRHIIALEGSILDLMASCDVLISDVSSVALDWLYLHTERPLWMTNPRDDEEKLLHASPAASGSYVVGNDDVAGVVARILGCLEADDKKAAREQLRNYYFGDLAPGQSTQRFIDEIDALVALRDKLVLSHDTTPHRIELEAGTS